MRPVRTAGRAVQDLRALALPPLRPASFFCPVVPPCFGELPEPDFLPPLDDAFGVFAIFAARSFDIPLSLRASYCFVFFGLSAMSDPSDVLDFTMACGVACHGCTRNQVAEHA